MELEHEQGVEGMENDSAPSTLKNLPKRLCIKITEGRPYSERILLRAAQVATKTIVETFTDIELVAGCGVKSRILFIDDTTKRVMFEACLGVLPTEQHVHMRGTYGHGSTLSFVDVEDVYLIEA
jgi:hypothetical protein